MEIGKRYKKVNGTYTEDPKGKYLAKRGPAGSVGVLDLSVKTPLGLPIDPTTKKPYADAGFTEDEVQAKITKCPHCGGKL